MPKRYAAVDIGTNTIKVKIIDQSRKNHFEQVFYKDFPSCLGQNMNDDNLISPTGLPDCYNVMNQIKKIIREKKVNEYKYVATHALREAANQKEILELFKSHTGIDIDVISGEEEAKFTMWGVMLDLPEQKTFACINAGGGSTELAFHLANEDHLFFFAFGALNLYQENIKNAADINSAIKAIELRITDEFNKKVTIHNPDVNEAISVGGSIYNAGYIYKKDKERIFEELAGLKISQEGLKSLIDLLKSSTDAEKKLIPGIDEKRLDTVLPGILIHYFLLKLLKQDEIMISTRSISDGLIYAMATGKI